MGGLTVPKTLEPRSPFLASLDRERVVDFWADPTVSEPMHLAALSVLLGTTWPEGVTEEQIVREYTEAAVRRREWKDA